MAKKNDYFKMFEDMVILACQSAEKLHEFFSNFHADAVEQKLGEMRALEHAGDSQKHELVKLLAKEFITPIEREDIMKIVCILDDVIDSIEDVLFRIYMYHIEKMRPEGVAFTEVIHQCCQELLCVFRLFPDFKKSGMNIHSGIIEINRLEETGDALYVSAVRDLYLEVSDAKEVFAWARIYDCLEKCCDVCEHTADMVEDVIMKNT